MLENNGGRSSVLSDREKRNISLDELIKAVNDWEPTEVFFVKLNERLLEAERAFELDASQKRPKSDFYTRMYTV